MYSIHAQHRPEGMTHVAEMAALTMRHCVSSSVGCHLVMSNMKRPQTVWLIADGEHIPEEHKDACHDHKS